MKKFEYIITEKREPISLGRVYIKRSSKPGIIGVYAEFNIGFEFMPYSGKIQIGYKKQIKYCSPFIVDLCYNMGISVDEFVSKYNRDFNGYYMPTSMDALIDFFRYKSEHDAAEMNRKLHDNIMKFLNNAEANGFISILNKNNGHD